MILILFVTVLWGSWKPWSPAHISFQVTESSDDHSPCLLDTCIIAPSDASNKKVQNVSVILLLSRAKSWDESLGGKDCSELMVFKDLIHSCLVLWVGQTIIMVGECSWASAAFLGRRSKEDRRNWRSYITFQHTLLVIYFLWIVLAFWSFCSPPKYHHILRLHLQTWLFIQVITQNLENSVLGYKEDYDEPYYTIRFWCSIFIIGQFQKKKKKLKQPH